MATSNVTPNVADEKVYSSEVKRKVENPFTGKEEIAIGSFTLPQALNVNDAMNLVQGSESDFLFWFNYGRRVAARSQITQALGFDLGDEKLNELFKSFTNALNNMVNEKTTQARRDAIKDFILSEEKFSALREKLGDNWKPEGVNIDFAVTELKKPSGKRGRPGKDSDDE